MNSLRRLHIVYFVASLLIILLSSNLTFADTSVGGIISTDTTWTLANSPYTLTKNAQIADGATLFIEPGVVVNGNGFAIQVWGVLNAIGTNILKIEFNNTIISPGDSGTSHYLINIQYAVISEGALHPPSGGAAYGSLILRDSFIQNTSTDVHLWYPTADCFIERNIFTHAGGINAGMGDYPNYGRKVYVRNNVFYRQQSCFYSDFCAIANWAAYNDSEMIVEYNSFLSTDRVAVTLPPGYSGSKMNASNNYWGTSDTNGINNMIYDKNDDLACADYINYLPILNNPHPDTPVLQFDLTVNISGTGSGTVTSVPANIDCGSDCQEKYNPDAVVTLEAVPDGNSAFNGWTNCDLISGNTCTLTMDSSKSVTANFTQNCDRTLTININPQDSGTVTRNPDEATYCNNEQVTLTATPNAGYIFSSWSSCDFSSNNICSVAMNSNKSVTATFNQLSYTINLSGAGNGSVKVNGTAHALPWSGQFQSGTNVQIEAVPDSGWSFASWTGDYVGSGNPTTININGNKTIAANFTQNCDRTLTINISPMGAGTVIKNPDKSSYCNNEQVTLTATPRSGYSFSSWSGVDSSNGTTAQVTMGSSKTVAANFTQNCDRILTINVSPPNSGTITKSPDKASYCDNEQVTLTASANPGYIFSSWSGVDSSNGMAASVSMSQSRTISAIFDVQILDAPDLTGQWSSLAQQCSGPKCKIKGTFNIQNIGNRNAATSYVRFYLSDDDIYDEADMFLKQVPIGVMKAGTSKNMTLSYSFPIGMDISATDKYVIAVVDTDNTMTESNQSNNIIVYGPIQRANLSGAWLALTQQCTGTKCKINGTLNIQNSGLQDAPSSLVRFYLSGSDSNDEGDTFLRQIASGMIKVGKSVNKKLSYTLPSGVTASGKYVIAVIDADNSVLETNDGDNVIAFGPVR